MKLLCCLLLALVAAGCTSKSKAAAKAKAAFQAGRQQALTRMYDLERNGIRILGPVQNPLILWTENLTLSQAIVAAEYQGNRDPQQIILEREGQRYTVDPRQLLRGEDIPLQPADIVEIQH